MTFSIIFITIIRIHIHGMTELKSQVQTRICVAGEQSCWEGPGGHGGQQDERGSSVHTCSNQDKLDPGLKDHC